MTGEIESRIRNVVAQELGISGDQANRDSRLREDLSADSLDFVELAMALEDEFEIELPDEDWNKVVTVGDIFELITRKITH